MRSEPLYPEYLASWQLDTPDPCQKNFFGEQIVAFYQYPSSCREKKSLILKIRYKNKEYEELVFPLIKTKGWWIFRLINDEYWKKGGILSYKIELYEKEMLISTWTHHLFVDLIEVRKTS